MHRVLRVSALVLVLVGCGRHAPELPIVLGPYDYERGDALFGVVARSVAGAGYEITRVEAGQGALVATAHTRVAREHPDILVTLFQEGWVSVHAVLPAHRGYAYRLQVETERLAIHIRDDLEREGYTAGGER